MAHGAKHMNYVGSMSGSLQNNKEQLEPPNFNKSPMLNTGKKLSNTTL